MLRPSEAVILTGPRLRDADDRATGLLETECGLFARGRKGAFRFGVPLALALDGVGLTPFTSMGLAAAIFFADGREGEDLAGDALGSLDVAVFAPGWVNLRRSVVVENHVGL